MTLRDAIIEKYNEKVLLHFIMKQSRDEFVTQTFDNLRINSRVWVDNFDEVPCLDMEVMVWSPSICLGNGVYTNEFIQLKGN